MKIEIDYDKYKGVKMPILLQKAQKLVNKYVRLRDSKDGYFKCISCRQTKPISQMNAGHYYPVGGFGVLRFNLNNIHGQCIRCNFHKHGNLIQYRKHLIKKIGIENVYILDEISKARNFKYDRLDIIEIIETYKHILN